MGWPSRLSSAQEAVTKFLIDVELMGEEIDNEIENSKRKKINKLP